jgi:UDP-sugar pyrophosphorylase
VRALQHNYPGGVAAYCSNARALLRASAAGENPFAGMTPVVPTGRKLEYASAEFVACEETGLAAFLDCAMVLVAGGLGERLGYTDIKVSLPVQVTTEMTYLELYVQQILAMQRASLARAGAGADARRFVPLAIMTSDDTHAKTVALLEKHANFGMAPGQLTIIKQEKVAALVDNDAHIALEEGSAYTIETKPHGHGDVHTLLASSGLAVKWRDEGRKYVVFFQDTNALCFTVTTAAIGVSVADKLDVNSVAIPRKAKDAVGAITKLVRADGSSITVNVEYNQLEPMLKASGFPEGDVNSSDGYSLYPGNINQLVFAIPPYCEVLASTGGLVPEFVNPKYADAAKNRFKKPTRLECMMQDHPKVVPPSTVVGFTQFPDWTYSPVKNDPKEALAKFVVGVPGRSALEGEIEFYGAHCRMLAAAGVALPAFGELRAQGFALPCPPQVVFHPNFAVSVAAFKGKFPSPQSVSISQRSALVISGPDVVVEGLELDGALVVTAVPGAKVTLAKGLKVSNAGWALVPLSDAEAAAQPDSVKIRGFRCVKTAARELVFTTPGTYVVSE